MPVGTHDGPNGSPDLMSSPADWIAAGVEVGHTVDNTTDGSTAIITTVTHTRLVCPLSGGVNNWWNTGDGYSTTP